MKQPFCQFKASRMHGKIPEPALRFDPLSALPSSFFKIMVADFGKAMFIPPKFAQNLQGLVDGDVCLEDAMGKRWEVKVRRMDGSLAFEQGWHEFVSDHFISSGEIVIFRHIGISVFSVHIFGTSGSERVHFEKKENNKETRKQNAEEITPDLLRLSEAQKNGETSQRKHKKKDSESENSDNHKRKRSKKEITPDILRLSKAQRNSDFSQGKHYTVSQKPEKEDSESYGSRMFHASSPKVRNLEARFDNYDSDNIRIKEDGRNSPIIWIRKASRNSPVILTDDDGTDTEIRNRDDSCLQKTSVRECGIKKQNTKDLTPDILHLIKSQRISESSRRKQNNLNQNPEKKDSESENITDHNRNWSKKEITPDILRLIEAQKKSDFSQGKLNTISQNTVKNDCESYGCQKFHASSSKAGHLEAPCSNSDSDNVRTEAAGRNSPIVLTDDDDTDTEIRAKDDSSLHKTSVRETRKKKQSMKETTPDILRLKKTQRNSRSSQRKQIYTRYSAPNTVNQTPEDESETSGNPKRKRSKKVITPDILRLSKAQRNSDFSQGEHSTVSQNPEKKDSESNHYRRLHASSSNVSHLEAPQNISDSDDKRIEAGRTSPKELQKPTVRENGKKIRNGKVSKRPTSYKEVTAAMMKSLLKPKDLEGRKEAVKLILSSSECPEASQSKMQSLNSKRTAMNEEKEAEVEKTLAMEHDEDNEGDLAACISQTAINSVHFEASQSKNNFEDVNRTTKHDKCEIKTEIKASSPIIPHSGSNEVKDPMRKWIHNAMNWIHTGGRLEPEKDKPEVPSKSLISNCDRDEQRNPTLSYEGTAHYGQNGGNLGNCLTPLATMEDRTAKEFPSNMENSHPESDNVVCHINHNFKGEIGVSKDASSMHSASKSNCSVLDDIVGINGVPNVSEGFARRFLVTEKGICHIDYGNFKGEIGMSNEDSNVFAASIDRARDEQRNPTLAYEGTSNCGQSEGDLGNLVTPLAMIEDRTVKEFLSNMENGPSQSVPNEVPEVDAKKDTPCSKAEDQLADRKEMTDQSDVLLPNLSQFRTTVSVISQSWLLLPEKLPVGRKRCNRKVVLLEYPSKTLWPVLYHESFNFVGFIVGWEDFTTANNLQPGDTCEISSIIALESTFQVQVLKNQT